MPRSVKGIVRDRGLCDRGLGQEGTPRHAGLPERILGREGCGGKARQGEPGQVFRPHGPERGARPDA
jgi:hypothetical protein